MSADLGFVHRFEPGEGSAAGWTLLLLHGTGGNEDDLLPLGRMLLSGAALLSPRGKVLEHGMPRFFRRLAEGVFDQADLAHRSAELAAFVRDAGAAYGIDPARTIAVGFSNGANVGASMMLRHPGVVRRGVLIRAMVPFVPGAPVDLSGHDVLLLQGRMDPLVPPANTDELAGILRDAGALVDVEWQPAGHALTMGDVRVATEWIGRHVAGSADR